MFLWKTIFLVADFIYLFIYNYVDQAANFMDNIMIELLQLHLSIHIENITSEMSMDFPCQQRLLWLYKIGHSCIFDIKYFNCLQKLVWRN